MMKNSKGYEVVQAENIPAFPDGHVRWEIRQYEGSLGYQIWRDGTFFTFAPTLRTARSFLR